MGWKGIEENEKTRNESIGKEEKESICIIIYNIIIYVYVQDIIYI